MRSNDMTDLMGGTELARVEANASMDNWEQFIDFVTALIDKEISDQSRAYKLRLAYEELLSNIIRASSEAPSEDNPITLEVSVLKNFRDDYNWLVLRTRDTGRHFDPHFYQRDAVDVDQPVHERKIGGLGLFLIQESVDHVAYDWNDGKNTYELCTKVS